MRNPVETAVRSSNEYAIAKVIASILVVIGHVTTFYTFAGGVVPMQPNTALDCVMRMIYSFHMPLFFFLSGAVYHQCISAGKYGDPVKFLAKKAKRLLVPYLIWGIFYVTPVMVLLGFTDQSPVKYIVDGILCCNNSRHLWFLWALFFISVGFRLLRPVVERGKAFELLLLVAALAAWYFSWRVNGWFNIRSILRYPLWYYLGYLFDERKAWFDHAIHRKLWIPAVSFAVMLPYLYLEHTVTRLVSASAGIVLVYWIVFHWNGRFLGSRAYQLLARNSFGIYLAHPMIIYVCFYCFQSQMHNPYITSLIVTLVALLGSIIITELLRRLKLGFALGESF